MRFCLGNADDRKVLGIFFLSLAIIGCMFLCDPFSVQQALASGSKINCDAHSGACTQTIGDVTVTLDMSPKPVTALTDLNFRVTVSGPASAKATHIDLGMPAMKMGPNRVELKSVTSGEYEGRGVIVKCASGRRTWYAIVPVPDFGEAIFVFDVIY